MIRYHVTDVFDANGIIVLVLDRDFTDVTCDIVIVNNIAYNFVLNSVKRFVTITPGIIYTPIEDVYFATNSEWNKDVKPWTSDLRSSIQYQAHKSALC